MKQMYRRRHEKPPLAVRCYYVANDLTQFTGDRQTSEQTEQTNRQREEHRRRVKPPHLRTSNVQL